MGKLVPPSKPSFPEGPFDIEGGAYAYNWVEIWLGCTDTVVEFQQKRGWFFVAEKEGWNGYGMGVFAKPKVSADTDFQAMDALEKVSVPEAVSFVDVG